METARRIFIASACGRLERKGDPLREGRLVRKFIGPVSEATLRAVLEELLT